MYICIYVYTIGEINPPFFLNNFRNRKIFLPDQDRILALGPPDLWTIGHVGVAQTPWKKEKKFVFGLVFTKLKIPEKKRRKMGLKFWIKEPRRIQGMVMISTFHLK